MNKREKDRQKSRDRNIDTESWWGVGCEEGVKEGARERETEYERQINIETDSWGASWEIDWGKEKTKGDY